VVAEEKIIRIGFGIIDLGYSGGAHSKTDRNTDGVYQLITILAFSICSLQEEK